MSTVPDISPQRDAPPRYNKLLIGDITKKYDEDEKRHSLASNAEKLEAFTRYDEIFADRLDYRLWRRIYHARFETPISSHWPETLRLARKALEIDDLVETWGAAALVSGLLRSTSLKRRLNEPLTQDELISLLDALAEWRDRDIPLLERIRHGCSLAKLFVLDATNVSGHITYPAAHTSAYFEQYVRAITGIDPDWKPGRLVNLEAYFGEVHREHTLLVLPRHKIPKAVQRVLFRIRHIIRAGISQHGFDGFDESARDALLVNIAQTTLSAWKLIRVIRLQQERRTDEGKVTYNLDWIRRDELRTLREAAVAHLEAGDPYTSSALSAYLLRNIPDKWVTEKDFWDMGHGAIFWIRQMGYEVDGRFLYTATDTSKSNASILERKVPASAEENEGDKVNFYYDRLLSDRKRLEDWKPILHQYPEDPRPLLRFISDLKRTEFQQVDLLAAYRLCLLYGRMGDAAYVFGEIEDPAYHDVLDFAHWMKRIQQMLPFGLDIERHGFWGRVLRRAFGRMLTNTETDFYGAFVVHEMVLGRHTAIAAFLPDAVGRQLVRKYYDALEDDEVDAMFKRHMPHDERVIKGPAIITASRMRDRLRMLETSELGFPVFVSFMRISTGRDREDDRMSVLAMSAGGQVRHEVLESPRIDKDIALKAVAVSRGSEFWPNFGVVWDDSLRRFRDEIVSIVKSTDPDTRWLILSPDSDFVSLPLQDLFWEKYDARFLVTLAANGSWLGMRRALKPIGVEVETGLEDDIREIAKRISDDQREIEELFGSAFIAVAHGEIIPSDPHRDTQVPTIKLGERPVPLPVWLDKINKRICVLHVCFGGSAPPMPMGDMGGIPGIALARGTRLFCSPVSEVQTQTALRFHECLIDPVNAGRPFGAVYLDAIKVDRLISLYNLYGLANELMLAQPLDTYYREV